METLYDLLGALPDDDAESLRIAFRRAVKAAHPDSNTDDLDTSLKFRRIVRANAILRDTEQRAAYDRLLALTLRRPGPKSKHTVIFDAIRKLASDAAIVTLISVVSIGGYVLFERLSHASAVPAEAIEVAAHGPAAIAAVVPTRQFDATVQDERDRLEGVAVPDKAVIPSAVASSASTGSAPSIAIVGAAPDLAVKPDSGVKPNLAVKPDLAGNHAKSYHQQGIFAYRDGDLDLAIADFDLAIELDPSFVNAYIDRGIAFYRLQKFDRAFADIAQAKRIENSNPFASLAAVSLPIELGSVSSNSTTTESKSTSARQSEKPASGHTRRAVRLVRTTAKSKVAVKDGAASLVPPPPRSSQMRPEGADNTTPAASDATQANIADPHPTVGVASTRTIQEQVAAATAVAERMTVATTAAAPDMNTDKVASPLANSIDLLVAVLVTRPDIRSVSELADKTIAIDDRYSASNSNVRIAIVAAGAPGVQLSEGQITAIDRVISGEVPAAVLTLTSPEAAEGFPEIAGFKIFLIPLSP